MRRFILLFFLGAISAAHCAAPPNVTTYAQMTAQLESDAAGCPEMRLVSLGKASGGLKDVWLVRLADPKADPGNTLRVMILCRQHGDEPASTQAILGLIDRLANGGDPGLLAALTRMTLYLVPMLNPTGAEAGTRQNSAGADLNRDWGVFRQPETRAVAQAVRWIRPQILIDAHNWDAGDAYDADCVEVAREERTPLGRMGHQVQQNMVRQLAASGYAVHPTAYGSESDPSLAHRYFSHLGILSLLIETHAGLPGDLADFQRRQGMYVAAIHALARRFGTSGYAARQRLEACEPNPATSEEARLFAPVPTLPRTVAGFLPPVLPLPLWLWPLCLYGLALGISALGRPFAGGKTPPAVLTATKGYYSHARKRDGTETRERSGQRRAVSSPPR